MLVTCPQCRRSIEAPAPKRSGTPALLVCPCCGKFAARPEVPEGQPKAGEPSAQWVPRIP
jgi:hypothetical protein